jgi:hypothetical protein
VVNWNLWTAGVSGINKSSEKQSIATFQPLLRSNVDFQISGRRNVEKNDGKCRLRLNPPVSLPKGLGTPAGGG